MATSVAEAEAVYRDVSARHRAALAGGSGSVEEAALLGALAGMALWLVQVARREADGG